MNMFSTSFLIFSSFFFFSLEATLNCDETDSCNTDISTTDLVSCSGYRSCTNIEIHTTTSNNGELGSLLCSGLRSCQNTIIDETYNINCNGFIGCYNLELSETSMLSSPNGNIYCSGTQSCLSATLIPYKYLYASGYQSLKSSNIYANTIVNQGLWVNIMGGYAADGTSFYNNGMDIIINFQGYYSGKDVDIYCYGAVTCKVSCYYNSCQDVRVYHTVDTIPEVLCLDDPSDCGITVTQISSIDDITSSKNRRLIESKKLQDVSSGMNNRNNIHDDIIDREPLYNNHEMGTSIHEKYSIHPHDSLASTSTTTCDDLNDCSNTVSSSIDTTYCYGKSSCSYSSFSEFSYLYCSGDSACTNSILSVTTGDSIHTATCHGSDSCSGSTIENLNYLYVSGSNAASYTSISNLRVIISSTEGTLKNAKISNDNSNLNLFSNSYNLEDSLIKIDGNTGNLYFRSQGSGNRMNIYCLNIATCSIHCYYGACQSSKVYVDSTSSYKLYCDETTTYCPTVEDYVSTDDTDDSDDTDDTDDSDSSSSALFSTTHLIIGGIGFFLVAFLGISVIYGKYSNKKFDYSPL